jgi:hypothetical protein
MRRFALIAVAAAILTPAPSAGSPPAEAPVVVWVAAQGGEKDAVFAIAAGWIEDLRILVVREEVEAPLDLLEAERTLLAHRALAVIWHDAGGALRVLLATGDRPEQIAVPAGGSTEEGLYLRELIAERLLEGGGLAAALVTVPDDIVAARPASPDASPIPAIPMEQRAPSRPVSGVKIGIGYAATAHFDDVVWWQQALRFVAPAVRLGPLVQTSLELELGLPAEIGEDDGASLELRTVSVSAGLSAFPLRRRVVELEAGIGLGPVHTEAVAFLPDERSERQAHTAGHVTAVIAVVFHPAVYVDIRARLDARYVIRPAGYSIGGQGDFGAAPWQPSGGIDIAFALFRR